MDTTSANVIKDVGNIDYYSRDIEPMLIPGSEEKLYEWLKTSGLISKQLYCNNKECNNEAMKWSKARVIDKYNWICLKCKKKMPIRHDTFLAELKCDFPSIFNAINGWCTHKLLSDVSDNKSYKLAIGKRIYSICSSAAELFMKSHPEYTTLGGKNNDDEEAVVIVDVFPEGCMTLQPQNNNNYTKKVLCIADTSYTPARVWAQMLDFNYEDDYGKIIEIILTHVKVNSTIVTSQVLYPHIKSIPGYTEIVNIKTLLTFDPVEHQKSLRNLETIWCATVETCQQIQNVNPNSAEQLLWELQWRQLFGSEAFYQILQHLTLYFNVNHTINLPKSNRGDR